MNEASRLIRKYPNRRLYDTTASCYITLDEIRQYVLQHEPFEVIDARSGENITHHVLLQIINERETGIHPFFTREILHGIIRFYDNPLQKHMRDFFHKGFSELKKSSGIADPLEKITTLAKENFALWQRIFTKDTPDKTHTPEEENGVKNAARKKSAGKKASPSARQKKSED